MNHHMLPTHSICVDLSPTSASAAEVCQQTRDATITIQCVSELTPLDMMDMSWGRADPTGSCIWLGAFLFIETFARNLQSADEEMKAVWTEIRTTIFPPGCHAVELGAGSGIAGLSLMATPSQYYDAASSGPSILVLTDANEECLELCRINRDANNDSRNAEDCIYVKKLDWGKGNASAVTGVQENGTTLPPSYDVVFATDVLYDLSSLAPLVATASELLGEGGYFVLSHVPRASTDDDEANTSSGVDSWQHLESIIYKEAAKANLHPAKLPISGDVKANSSAAINESNHGILRPALLPRLWKKSSPLSKKHSWQRMIDAGAAILIFQKKEHD